MMHGAYRVVGGPMNWPGVFLLSAAALAFEINLTRVFSVSQFYHFAFMTVSLALLGFAASGTLLSLTPRLARRPTRALTGCAWGFALSSVGSYGLTLVLPFDSFRVALEPAQWGVLALHYVALALPFLCAGTAVGLLLQLRPGAVGRTYAANLAGSAVGCAVAVAAPALVGAEGGVLVAATLAAAAAVCFGMPRPAMAAATPPLFRTLFPSLLLLAGCLALTLWRPPWLAIRLSPYKGLSYAMQYPDARLTFQAWNGFSRVDVVESSAIRSMPGQGFACAQQPPPQRGLFVDGDNLSPITRLSDPAELRPLTDCLLTALPYRLRPAAEALVLDPRGGFDLWVALAEGAQTVTAVEPNPLVVEAVRAQGAWAGDIYDRPQVQLFEEEGRAFLARRGPRYDVILIPPPGNYHPVTSGDYALAENYTFTVEGFVAALERLDDGGLLVVVRWLQVPPSESLRAFAVAVEAVERTGGNAASSLVALRSYSQMLILARRGPFTPQEVDAVRAFAAARRFDLVAAPGLRAEEVNQYNVLPGGDFYAETFNGLLAAEDRAAWLAAYPFDVAPPTDDRPFFEHYFRWRQAGEVLATAGHVWQPFGGAGYLVLLVLLAVATVAAAALVLLPLAGLRATRSGGAHGRAPLLPFGLLGLAYLFVEIPLMQRFILFLGQPAISMATVLGTLLLFSGLGSLLSSRVRLGAALAALVALVVLYRLALPALSGPLLGLPLAARVLLTVVALGPLATLMGVPFPALLGRLRAHEGDHGDHEGDHAAAEGDHGDHEGDHGANEGDHGGSPLRLPALLGRLRAHEGDHAAAEGDHGAAEGDHGDHEGDHGDHEGDYGAHAGDHGGSPLRVSWAWGVNGALSVVASVLAALIGLAWGLGAVMGAGALAYLGVWATSGRLRHGEGVACASTPGPVNGTKRTPPWL